MESVYKDEEFTITAEIDTSKFLTFNHRGGEGPYDEWKPSFEHCKGLVSGWANVSMYANGKPPMDWQDDVIPTDVLEKAAIDFMLDYRDSGVMHQGTSKGTVVESIVFTKEKMAAIGIPENTVNEGWFITVKIFDKETFDKVVNGTYRMFSIQGRIQRLPV